MHRAIYECKSCAKHCTVRTKETEKPTKCIYWKDYCCFVRKDKHEQKNIEEFKGTKQCVKCACYVWNDFTGCFECGCEPNCHFIPDVE